MAAQTGTADTAGTGANHAWLALTGRVLGLPAGRLGAAALKVTLALADEGVASSANLALSIILARWFAPQDYGLFALLYYGIATGSVGFYNALVLQPMMVLGPARHADHLPLYLRLLARWQRLALLFLFLLIALGGLAYGVWAGDAGITRALVGLAVAVPGLIYMQYVRRLCYIRHQPTAAAARGLAYALLLALGLGLLAGLRALNPGTVLMAMGLAGFGSGLAAGRYVAKMGGAGRADGSSPQDSRQVLRELWGYGRWVAAANVAGWAAQSLPYFLSSSLLGLTGTGAFQASQNLAKPLPHLNNSFRLLTLPSWSEKWGKKGNRAVAPQAVRWGLLLGGMALIYALGMVLVGPFLFGEVYRGRYVFDLILAGSLLLGMACQSATAGFMTGLQAMQLPQVGVKAQLAAVALGISLGPFMVRAWGVTGLGPWVALQAAAQLFVVVVAFRREVRSAARDAVHQGGSG